MKLLKLTFIPLVTLIISGCSQRMEFTHKVDYLDSFYPKGSIDVHTSKDTIKENNFRTKIFKKLYEIGFDNRDIWEAVRREKTDYSLFFTLQEDTKKELNHAYLESINTAPKNSSEGLGRSIGYAFSGRPKLYNTYKTYIFSMSITNNNLDKQAYSASIGFIDNHNAPQDIIEKCMLETAFENFQSYNGVTKKLIVTVDEDKNCNVSH